MVRLLVGGEGVLAMADVLRNPLAKLYNALLLPFTLDASIAKCSPMCFERFRCVCSVFCVFSYFRIFYIFRSPHILPPYTFPKG